MTNLQIVINEAITNNIFTEDQLQGYIDEGDIPLKTFLEWRKAGYIVRKGQKARLETKLWLKARKKKDKKNQEEDSHFIMAPAYLFTADQVAKIGE